MVSIHRRIPFRRRTAAALVATATALLLGPSLVPAAAAASPLQAGLFGDQDPTYDGVFRQSLGLLAYAAVGETPPADAVSWLLGQQCPDGGFQAFRPVASDPCQKSDPIAYAGEDTNSTGIAAAALRAIGQSHAADRALAWAAGAQNSDGGFPYFVGGSSDANSTAVVLFGTNTAGRPPASVAVGGVSAVDFLVGLQLGCAGAATDDDGGFAFQDYGSGLLDNDAASVQAVLALSGAALPVTPRTVSTSVPRADCTTSPPPSTTAGAAELGAGHLARVLDAFSGAVPQFDYSSGARVPGSVSAGDTAWAAMSLAAVGIGRSQLDAALGVLGAAPTTAAGVRTGRVADAAAAAATADQPGQLALVALAARAGGTGVATVGAYVARIGATMRLAPAAPAPSPSSSTAPSASSSAAPSASSSATPSGSPTRSASASPSVSPTSSASPSSSDLGALSPTGATLLTPVLGVLGVALLLAGLGLLTTARRRSAHA